METITIPREEYDALKEKAHKWDSYTEKLTKNLPYKRMTAKERSEAARKAVQARWAKRKGKKTQDDA